MIDVLLVLIALCLIPAALVGLALAFAAVGTIIGLPVAWVLDRIESARARRRFKKRQAERARRNKPEDYGVNER